MLVSVNQKDVDLAKRKNPEACALARACTRSHGDVKRAYFFRSSAWLEYDDRIVRYALPPSTQKEIVAFDRAKAFEPGVYQLSTPRKSIRLDAVKSRSTKQRSKGRTPRGHTVRKVLRHHTQNVRSAFDPRIAKSD
jgi:hypothetical protein